MSGNNVSIGSLRVTDDIIGFRNIYAKKLNTNGFTTSGRIIADKATVTNSVNVAKDLNLKADSSRTISSFIAIKAGTVYTPFLSTAEIVFPESFGLTVSGELMMSTNSPIKFGSWVFPSLTPPSFSQLSIGRAQIPTVPNATEFGPLMTDNWQTVAPRENTEQP